VTCLLFFIYIWGATGPIQDSQDILSTLSLSEKSERIEGKDLKTPHQLAYWPILPDTDKVWIDGVLKTRDVQYTFDYRLGQLSLKTKVTPESIVRIHYQIIPISVKKSYHRQLFAPAGPQPPEQAGTSPGTTPEIMGTTRMKESPSELVFSGAKTVSLSMESARGLTINQPTRLNVSGKVSENVSVMAMLSDQDLPLQPEGTTEEIADLDRILIKIQGKHLSATLGDYEAGFGETEFVLLPKMLEGAQAQGEFNVGGFTLLGAVSRGQTSSVTLPGVEGQNEYRINVDGRFIIMIAGSETVWLNGEKMRRGEENDYIIREYGDPIVEFTNKRLITGNDVIVVDFEFIEEDRSYRQDLYGTRGKVNIMGLGEGLTLGVSYATEADDKDNPLIFLSDDDIASLQLNELDPDGDGILLQAPERRSVIGLDGRLSIGDRTNLGGEIALGKLDLNTFSPYDKLEEGKAWKLNGSSGIGKFHVDFDLRRLDPEFIPIGATISSRTRYTYQEDYSDINFNDVSANVQTTPTGEESYDLDFWYEPMEHVELRGDLGRTSSEHAVDASSTVSERATNHWSRSMKFALPNLPQISTRYQEAVTDVDDKDDLKKTREMWQVDHKLWGKLNIGARSEDLESIDHADASEISDSASNRNRRRKERRFIMAVPPFKKVSLSGEYSFETEYTNPEFMEWIKSSSARTVSANLSTRPLSWLDFSGYFARRKFSRLSPPGSADIPSGSSGLPTDSTTNLTDLKLKLKSLRINYQIDRKLSTEREEQYVNYIITRVDGVEEQHFLRPGEGHYVKIDEFTYREDMEEGDYIRLVRTISDRPVTALTFQSVLNFRPRSSFRARPVSADQSVRPSMIERLTKLLQMLEIGMRVSEEQERASSGFYLLQDLQTDNTIHGLRRYWYRTQLSPIERFRINTNWETGRTINKRINNRARELEFHRWNVKLESQLTKIFSLGGEWEQDDSFETVSSLLETAEGNIISDISERQQSRSLFLIYRSARALSRFKLEGAYDTEWDEDALSDELPVFTETLSLGSEATWSFSGKGTTTMKYRIARGVSSGDLPFARFDFHEGISHRIRLELSYRLKWFTDVTARFIYRAEIAELEKPDHRLEMEMTANF